MSFCMWPQYSQSSLSSCLVCFCLTESSLLLLKVQDSSSAWVAISGPHAPGLCTLFAIYSTNT
jgi:hypothetical protein